jgi:hypothetical protein
MTLNALDGSCPIAPTACGTTVVTSVSKTGGDRIRYMRRLRILGLGMVAFLFLSLICIHIYARIFRYRVEHLLSILKTLKAEETPAAAILKLRAEYQSNVINDGPCSEEHCQFSISLIEWESLNRITLNHPWAERPRYDLVWGLRFFGLRINGFMASLGVEHGKLRSVRVWFFPMSYIEHSYADGHGFLSDFLIRAGTVGNFRRWVGWRQVYEHPNLLAWKPSACTGCSGAINAEFTWQVGRDEYARAIDINLSCITQIRDCRSPEEYLPRAAEVLKEDAARNLAHGWGDMPCDVRTAQILGRDSDFVDVVRIKSVKTGDDGYVILDFDVSKPLKGSKSMLNNIYYPKKFATGAWQPDSSPAERLLELGSERIVFLSKILDKPSVKSNCALIASTQQTMRAAEEGIAADHSAILNGE